MKIGFGKKDVPEIFAFAARYVPLHTFGAARQSLRVLSTGNNQQTIYSDTLYHNLPALSLLLNQLNRNIENEYGCDFFKKNKISFNLVPSYTEALEQILKFNNLNEKPYSDQINNYISRDLLRVVNIVMSCNEVQRQRENIDLDRELKKPTIKPLSEYPYLFVGESRSVLLQQKHNDPVLSAYNILKAGLRLNEMSTENLSKLHRCLEKILINGWSYYYKNIKKSFSVTNIDSNYAAIINRLEIIGSNIFNVALIGRHNRQISAIDDINLHSEEHAELILKLKGFIGNVFGLFLAYNYFSNLSDRVAITPSDVNSSVIYTWTCGFCNRKLGNSKPSVAHHTLMFDDADAEAEGEKRKAECPGKKHPPLEVSSSALRIKADMANTQYENARIELESLDTTTSMLVVGKYANRVFTPRDLSWNDRLSKAKASKKIVVDHLKVLRDEAYLQLKEWKPINIGAVPVWSATTKQKVA